MNYYLRYFDDEALVHNADEAIDFLCGIREIDVTPIMEQEVRQYLASDIRFPKRYKVRAHVYFIIIKTDANSMEEFKERRSGKEQASPAQKEAGAKFALGETPVAAPSVRRENLRPSQMAVVLMQEPRPGWYEGTLDFKRVTTDPRTGKFVYRDTRVSAQLKAQSPMDCYQRLVAHLQQRVDQRSQVPSVKGKNFQYKVLGAAK